MSASRKDRDKRPEKDGKYTSRRTRGRYTTIFVTGSGTVKDPQITWLIGRPKHGVGELYEQFIREAAMVSGLGAWYIRSLVHTTTSLGGAAVRDNPHFTVFADKESGRSPQEDFELEGHVYVAMGENNYPRRLLHPEEFELTDPARAAPVVLYGTTSQRAYTYFVPDYYYDYHDADEYNDEGEGEPLQTRVDEEGKKRKPTKKRYRRRKDKGQA